MSRSALWEALRPVAARMPKAVHEHEILRIAATISSKDPLVAAATARSEVLKWVQKRAGGRLPPNAWSFADFEYLSGGRNSAAVRIQTDASDIWAIRADDPDKTVPGRVWTTEVVVGLMPNQTPRFSARLLVSTPEDELDIEPHTPGFVKQVAEKCSLLRGAYEISPDPWLINSEYEVDQLLDMLVDPQRKLPLFVLTVPDGAADPDSPLLDAQGLAFASLGIGHVAIVPDAYTWALTRRLGRQRSVFGGAVRAYLPGFAEDANPFGHRLVLADHVATPDGAAQCTRWMRSLAAAESLRRSRLGDDVLAFGAIKDAGLRFRQQQLEDEGASDTEQLAIAKARIGALEKQLEEEEALLADFSGEHRKAEERAEAAEEQLRASAFRIQQLIEQIKERGDNADAAIELPESWTEFANWCDTKLAGRVVLSPPARRGVRAPEFEDVELAARCLLWLANDCRDRRMVGGDGSLKDENIEEGIRNAHCGADQFDLDWQGQRYTADWHIKTGGNTRNPAYCLRIYYFWDPASQQIVVADMPAHRRTGAT